MALARLFRPTVSGRNSLRLEGPWSHARLKASATEPALRKQKSMKALSGGRDVGIHTIFLTSKTKACHPSWRPGRKRCGNSACRRSGSRARKRQPSRSKQKPDSSSGKARTMLPLVFREPSAGRWRATSWRSTRSRSWRSGEWDHNEQLADAGPQASEKGDVAAGGCKDAPDVSSPRVAPRGSIFQLDFDADTPKLSDLKKALSRASRISRRSTHVSKVEQELHEALESRSRSQSRELPELPRPMVVPVDLIEKHKLLMSMEVLDPWPPAAPGHSELQRVRRKWEGLHRKPRGSTTEVLALVEATAADLRPLRLPLLPASPKGPLVFSARLSGAHPEKDRDWAMVRRPLEEGEVDAWSERRPSHSGRDRIRFRTCSKRIP
ncbi:unnamed protein product [Durusdinium trenchii]|uniref:Uncharacterized protein n=1 Tax=Durusdinium trenchii TaxID=1381693 RepID=A0ABP0JKF2_9DINO